MVHPTDAKESSIHHASIASTSAPDSSIESLAIGKRDGGPAPILAPQKNLPNVHLSTEGRIRIRLTSPPTERSQKKS